MKKRKFSKSDAHEMYARMDVGTKIAEAMNHRDIKMPKLAKMSGLTVRKIRFIISGDAKITLAQMIALFHVLGCRFDLVVTPALSDEWTIKRAIHKLEKKAWRKAGDP